MKERIGASILLLILCISSTRCYLDPNSGGRRELDNHRQLKAKTESDSCPSDEIGKGIKPYENVILIPNKSTKRMDFVISGISAQKEIPFKGISDDSVESEKMKTWTHTGRNYWSLKLSINPQSFSRLNANSTQIWSTDVNIELDTKEDCDSSSKADKQQSSNSYPMRLSLSQKPNMEEINFGRVTTHLGNDSKLLSIKSVPPVQSRILRDHTFKAFVPGEPVDLRILVDTDSKISDLFADFDDKTEKLTSNLRQDDLWDTYEDGKRVYLLHSDMEESHSLYFRFMDSQGRITYSVCNVTVKSSSLWIWMVFGMLGIIGGSLYGAYLSFKNGENFQEEKPEEKSREGEDDKTRLVEVETEDQVEVSLVRR
mmetsp:Transcript_49057/g.56389  ORF Transcript_49057/g.56389 Transcript_49057/m.56389 type:complete len:370 (+) Transcript_49057:35-1144(+)